ncbi:MAG: hypothetical protein J6M65_11500 [Eubacterium sp.]|nr:hypothetical protein [Eubacterium sp.]
MAVIERLGGFCHGRECVVKEKVKSGIKTVTEVLPTLYSRLIMSQIIHRK